MTAPSATPAPIVAWHAIADALDPTTLPDLLAEEVVFRSPAVHTPQQGKAVTLAYLHAALDVLGPTLRYVQEWYADRSAVLEFVADLDGVSVHGVDMIRWNDDGRIVEFTVMARPFKGLQELITRMGARLQRG